jgi:hypothetical protein
MKHRGYILMLVLIAYTTPGCGGLVADGFTIAPEPSPTPISPKGAIIENVNLEGNITENSILISSKSPYYVIGELVVMKDAVLTIEAGTIVKFATDKGLYIDGGLDARGKPSDLIIFTSAKASPEAGDWRWIEFRGLKESLMKYCKIEYAQAGVLTLSSSPEITYSMISRNKVGVRIEEGSSPKITMSDIYNNEDFDLQILPSNNGRLSSSTTLDVSNNWWGTTDETVIVEHIYDASDDSTLRTRAEYNPVSGVKTFSEEK